MLTNMGRLKEIMAVNDEYQQQFVMPFRLKGVERLSILHSLVLGLQGGDSLMWTVIYIAPNKQTAENLKEALEQEGILVNLRATGLSSASGGAHFELMVPKTEAREAHEILNEALGRSRFKK